MWVTSSLSASLSVLNTHLLGHGKIIGVTFFLGSHTDA